MSFKTEPSLTLRILLDFAWHDGVVLVAAAGNDKGDAPVYPAYYDNCIAVAATDKNDARAEFSNYGAWVDIAAPGVDIFSTMPNHNNSMGSLNYGSDEGTSASAPYVAGVAALIFARYPTWSNSKVREKIEASVDPTTKFTTTIGRINALKAVQ